MSKQSPSTRIRITSHVTQTRFLHVADALKLGKIRLFAGSYRRGQGLSAHTAHYLDLASARVICHALLNGEQGFSYKEYKGSPLSSGQQTASTESVKSSGRSRIQELLRSYP